MRSVVCKRERRPLWSLQVFEPLSVAPFEEAQITEGDMDPVGVVVHDCIVTDVEMVVVDGHLAVEDVELLTMDEE